MQEPRKAAPWRGRASRFRPLRSRSSNHADDLVLFDVPPPLQSRGNDAYRKSWTGQFFPWFGDAGLLEIDELQVTAGDDVALCQGRWTVVHEHPLGSSALRPAWWS